MNGYNGPPSENASYNSRPRYLSLSISFFLFVCHFIADLGISLSLFLPICLLLYSRPRNLSLSFSLSFSLSLSSYLLLYLSFSLFFPYLSVLICLFFSFFLTFDLSFSSCLFLFLSLCFFLIFVYTFYSSCRHNSLSLPQELSLRR